MSPLLCRALMSVAASLALPCVPTFAATPEGDGAGRAWFEDHWINLEVDWEEAGACHVGVTTVCYRTEKDMDADLAATGEAVTLAASCASSVRLYDGISYTNNVLLLSQRLTPLNLSSYGFDNATTSYKVGGCDADFYAGANLGGSTYPGNTAAFAQSPSMATGWNNVISSVYIN